MRNSHAYHIGFKDKSWVWQLIERMGQVAVYSLGIYHNSLTRADILLIGITPIQLASE